MKNFIYIVCLLGLSATSIEAQDWGKYFVAQDFAKIESNLSEDVTLKIGGDKKITDTAQVMSQLKQKISSFGPISYSSKHKGTNDSSENYYIAELVNDSGAKMRVFIHLENSANGKRICDIKMRPL